eukprot:COSAG02_NODE_44406_length_366_cov_1.149813_1_plen_97_part_10
MDANPSSELRHQQSHLYDSGYTVPQQPIQQRPYQQFGQPYEQYQAYQLQNPLPTSRVERELSRLTSQYDTYDTAEDDRLQEQLRRQRAARLERLRRE